MEVKDLSMIRTITHFLLAAVLLIEGGKAEAQRMEWIARTSSNGSNLRTYMAVDADGNSFLAGEFSGGISVGGYTFSSGNPEDIVLVKFDPDGTVLWAEQFGSDNDEMLQALATDDQGNVFMGISPSGFGTVFLAHDTVITLPSIGARGMVIKVAPDGAVSRVHLSNGCRFDVAGSDVYNVYSPTLGTYALERLDGDLEIVWQQTLGSLVLSYFSIDADPAGYVAIAGSEFTQDSMSVQGIPVPNDPSDLNEAIVLRMDLDGNVQWIRTYGASNSLLERPQGIAVGADGRVYVATRSDTAFTFAGGGFPALAGYDGKVGFLLAYDAVGEEDWAIPAYSHFDQVTFWDVIVDDDGNVVSSADLVDGGLVNGLPVPATQRPFGLLKTDADGNTIWLKHPVEEATLMNCPAFDLGQSSDGAYYLGGFGQSFSLDCITLPITGGYNYYVMRIVEEPWIGPEAGFTWIDNGLEVQFTDGSTNAASWSWVFGDGAVSADTAPFHTYPGNGTYHVTQTVGYGICTDVFTDTLELFSTDIAVTGPMEEGGVLFLADGSCQLLAPLLMGGHFSAFDAAGRMVFHRYLTPGERYLITQVADLALVAMRTATWQRTFKVIRP